MERWPFGVIKKGQRSIGRVGAAGGVQQERCSASGRILIAAVEHKGSSANTGIEAAGGIAPERQETDCRIISAGGETQKRGLPFCRVASGIAAIRRRNNPESIRGR